MIRRFAAPFLALLLIPALPLPAHDAGVQMAEVANVFLASLSPEQTARASFAFEDAERINSRSRQSRRPAPASPLRTPNVSTGTSSRASARVWP